jgi:hypothetical protein
MSDVNHLFRAWQRQGIAATLDTPRNPIDDASQAASGGAVGLQSRVVFSAQALVNGTPAPPAAQLHMYGPGEVTGFDPRLVIRTEPRQGASDFEPNFFACVEFGRPDFPWLFSPYSATHDGKRMLPWLTLIVVERRDGVLYRAGNPLPVLEIASNASWELPDPLQAWAWAHAHAVQAVDAAGNLTGAAPTWATRLMCPRHLAGRTAYLACVVPLFEVGRKAGLGETFDNSPGGADDNLAFAWQTTAASVALPVYYSWEFTTSETGSFESLAEGLRKRPSGAGGARTVAATSQDVGFGLPAASLRPDETLPFGGALSASPAVAPVNPAFQRLLGTAVLSLDPRVRAVMRPPVYGGFHAQSPGSPYATAQSSQAAGQAYRGPDRPWLEELNLDPTLRYAAALGTRVVQAQQEQLMAEAWEQIGEVQRANELLRQGQLARAASGGCYERHVTSLDPAVGLMVTSSVHSRVPRSDKDSTTIRGVLETRPDVGSTLSPAFRRVTRDRGRLARRARTARGLGARLVERVNRGNVSADPEAADGTVTLPIDVDVLQGKIDARWPQELRAVVERLLVKSPRRPHGEGLPLATLYERVKRYIDPEITITRRLWWRLDIEERDTRDPLDPVLAAPEITAPQYRSLADLSQDYFLPGVAAVPPNSISALSPDRRFIEAFMVGLNHEFGRELLWRGYPTDQRCTSFRQFWDTAGHVPPLLTPAEVEDHRDITPIHAWRGAMGEHGTVSSGEATTVLIVRGDLLRRYPRTVVYAVQAEWADAAHTARRLPETAVVEKFPAFQGRLSPDLTFLGFDLSPAAMRGDASIPGWFFMLQEPPGEPRFGLDEGSAAAGGDWLELAWGHVAKPSNGKPGSEYVDVAGPLSGFTPPPNDESWSRTSSAADFAVVTRRPPVRVAVHASDLLP